MNYIHIVWLACSVLFLALSLTADKHYLKYYKTSDWLFLAGFTLFGPVGLIMVFIAWKDGDIFQKEVK
jgi:hypothetical protein